MKQGVIADKNCNDKIHFPSVSFPNFNSHFQVIEMYILKKGKKKTVGNISKLAETEKIFIFFFWSVQIDILNNKQSAHNV